MDGCTVVAAAAVVVANVADAETFERAIVAAGCSLWGSSPPHL